jgi:hypothetical protein
MTRLVFIASLLAFSTAVAVNHASAQKRCDETASQCLGGCVNKSSSGINSPYAQCATKCDNACDACRGRVKPRDDLFDSRR